MMPPILLSMENLLATIDKFSKVSGLEVNKTKSECLILDFEMNLSSHESTMLGVPLVDNLKILGHHFGKNKMVCDYHNFYSKLSKYDKIVNTWKQRSLTIIGRNLLINALLNSLFSFNAQIEHPPVEFLKEMELKNKNFLWDGGVSKISHHSIIGDFPQGGIRYKDLDSYLTAINLKFIVRLSQNTVQNSICLPRYWLMSFFNIPVQNTEGDKQYFQEFFDEQLSILDCKFKLPKKSVWKGHPFYLSLLSAYERLIQETPKSLEALLSTPLWFNSQLGTKFDARLSKSGFNYIRDIVYYKCKPSPFQNAELQYIAQKVTQLKDRISDEVKSKIAIEIDKTVIIHPVQTIRYNAEDMFLGKMNSKTLYKILIAPKLRVPKGLLNWCLELELTFAHQCSINTFDRVFQFKIATYILPTNEYLVRYRVKDSDLCDLCQQESDTIVHRLYECEYIICKIDIILSYLQEKCNPSY